MQVPKKPESQPTEGMKAPPCSPHNASADPTVTLTTFIEKRFIPNHVELKSLAGRTHYHSILKHILKPETVERLLVPYIGIGKSRLKAIPDWPYLDDVRLCDLSADHVRQLTSSASAQGYSLQTVKHIRSVISAIISHAKRERMFTGENPISQVEVPPLSHRESHSLTIFEAKTILETMQYPEREIALITMTTGMSISEICALQWKHVNLTGSSVYAEGMLIPPGSILVCRQWNSAGVVDAKNNHVRNVGVPAPLIQALTRLRRDRGVVDSNSFVIATHKGNPIRPSNVRTLRVKPIGRLLKMPWLSWQVLKRGHEALLSELRVQLSDDLVRSMPRSRQGGQPWRPMRGKSGQARYPDAGVTFPINPDDAAWLSGG